MESTPPTVRRGLVPLQEYLLQGSIMDGACEVLLHRLRGLCDNSDSPIESFHDYEMVFQIRGPTGTPLSVRARQSLDSPPDAMAPSLPGATRSWRQKQTHRYGLSVRF
ncbi:hypothetical protein MTO96_017269 [Rhipicephalus appendiculatus]